MVKGSYGQMILWSYGHIQYMIICFYGHIYGPIVLSSWLSVLPLLAVGILLTHSVSYSKNFVTFQLLFGIVSLMKPLLFNSLSMTVLLATLVNVSYLPC